MVALFLRRNGAHGGTALLDLFVWTFEGCDASPHKDFLAPKMSKLRRPSPFTELNFFE